MFLQFVQSKQHRKLIFGMEPNFNPTQRNMEDNLFFFVNGRRPKFFQMEDNVNFFSQIDIDDLLIFLNGRRTKTIGIQTMAVALLRVTYK